MKTIIHWFRRDLRLSDNTSLFHASQDGDCVVLAFCLDPAILSRKDIGARRVAFLLEALRSLAHDLRALGTHLHVLHGKPEEELLRLVQATNASALYWNRDYEPYATKRDETVEAVAHSQGIATKSFTDTLLHPPGQPLNGQGSPYTVFTPFAKTWRAQPHPPILPSFVPPRGDDSLPNPDPIPSLPELGFPDQPSSWPATEQEASERLKRFLDHALMTYPLDRDFPSLEGTSKLSPYLHFGLLSARTVFHRAEAQRVGLSPAERSGVDVFTNELIWREFYTHILAHFPHVATGPFRREYQSLRWPGNTDLFQAWAQGKTGYPLVDAAMRQLNTTGWMHNRLRMVTAMFLTKDLLLDWRLGERYFMLNLLDGNLAANNGGWQWSASTGTDAAPYFRVFSPVSQSRKFDPHGEFIRRYVPELASLPTSVLHAPWEAGVDTKSLGYPTPIVDHAVQRLRVMELFQAHKARRRSS